MPESLFLINPNSAKVRKRGFDKLAEIIYTIYRDAGITVEVRKLDFNLLSAWIENAPSKGIRNIYAVGGDGTANGVGAAMVDKKHLRLGVIPLGSGNGLARNIGFSTNFDLAIRQSISTHAILIDIGKFGDHIFLNAAGLGLDADVVTRYQHSKTRGITAYASEIFKSLIHYSPQNYEIEIDGKTELLTNVWVLDLMNGVQWGYDAVPSPDSLITDGYFELIYLQKVSFFHAFIDISLLLMQKIQQSPRVGTIRCQSVRIKQAAPSPGHVDGEHIKVGKEIEVKILPKALYLLLPKTLTKIKMDNI